MFINDVLYEYIYTPKLIVRCTHTSKDQLFAKVVESEMWQYKVGDHSATWNVDVFIPVTNAKTREDCL